MQKIHDNIIIPLSVILVLDGKISSRLCVRAPFWPLFYLVFILTILVKPVLLIVFVQLLYTQMIFYRYLCSCGLKKSNLFVWTWISLHLRLLFGLEDITLSHWYMLYRLCYKPVLWNCWRQIILQLSRLVNIILILDYLVLYLLNKLTSSNSNLKT